MLAVVGDTADVTACPEDVMTPGDRAKPGTEPNSVVHAPADRRTRNRKRQRLVDGFILSVHTPTPRPCTVCNMSVSGSKIELWNDSARALWPGDVVTLYIPVDGKEVDAEVRWRRDSAIGMRFISPFRDPTRPYD